MKRGSGNESAMAQYLSGEIGLCLLYYLCANSMFVGLPCVKAVFQCGMIARKEQPWFASSPDMLAVLDLNAVDAIDDNSEVIAVVEFKTAVGAATASAFLQNASPDLVFCNFGDYICRSVRSCSIIVYANVDAIRALQHASPKFLKQILMQLWTTSTSFALFVSATESSVCSTVLMRLREPDRALVSSEMTKMSFLVDWAHDSTIEKAVETMPAEVDEEYHDIVKSHLPFWQLVNERALSEGQLPICFPTLILLTAGLQGPFPPLKLFKNAVQTFYSKTKPGVDGLTQNRAVLANASAGFKWEQMVAIKGLQTCAHNAHIAFKLNQRRDLVSNAESFENLARFRERVAHVEGFSTFCFQAALEMINQSGVMADAATKSDATDEPASTGPSVTRYRIDVWNREVKKRQRYVYTISCHPFFYSAMLILAW